MYQGENCSPDASVKLGSITYTHFLWIIYYGYMQAGRIFLPDKPINRRNPLALVRLLSWSNHNKSIVLTELHQESLASNSYSGLDQDKSTTEDRIGYLHLILCAPLGKVEYTNPSELQFPNNIIKFNLWSSLHCKLRILLNEKLQWK